MTFLSEIHTIFGSFYCVCSMRYDENVCLLSIEAKLLGSNTLHSGFRPIRIAGAPTIP